MKKLSFLIAFLLVSGLAFAGTPSLAEVLEWKYGPVASTCQRDQSDTSPNPKMYICGWRSEEPQPTYDQIVELTQTYAASQDYQIKGFSVHKFLGSLLQIIPPQRWVELSKLGVGWTMQQLVEYPNFSGLRDYLGALQNDGTLTITDIAEINQVLLEQGIDLSKL